MLYQILPKTDYIHNQESMIMFFKTISNVKSKKKFIQKLFSNFDLKWIIDCDEKEKISFYLNIDNSLDPQMTLNALGVLFQGKAEVFESESQLEKHDTYNTLAFGDNYKSKGLGNNLAPFANPSLFFNIIGLLQPYTRIEVSFAIKGVEATKGKSDVDIELLFQVTGKTKYLRNIVIDISKSISSLTAFNTELFVNFKDKFIPIRLSGTEITNIIQIPSLKDADKTILDKVYHLIPGQVTLGKNEFYKGIYVGKLHHPIQKDRNVYISLEHARKHALISGTTGSGKSSEIEEWIESLLLQKLEDKPSPGFTFLDPLESSVLGVIDKILKLESDGHDISKILDKVRYVDLSTDEYIFPISLLNKNTDATLVIDFFKSLYGETNAIQVNRMLASAVSTIMLDEQEHSVFDLERIFEDELFRSEMVGKLAKNIYAQDEVNFLKNTKFTPTIAAPILNRLASFKNTPQKKLMFALPSKYDALSEIRKWMDEGYIVLFNLKGLSKFDIEVIVGYLSMQYYLQAKSRPDFSLLHFLMVDEAHNVQMPIFPKVCAEMRKSGLSLVLLTQMLEQFNSDFLEQLIGNINTLISFKQKTKAAVELQKRIPSQDVRSEHLLQLQSMVGYLSMEESGIERSILIKAKPPFRYTKGKLVNHEDPLEVQENLNKNRSFALELMKRDYMTKKKAENMVFRNLNDDEELEELEEELLRNGDSLPNILLEEESKEEGGVIQWED